MPLLVTGSIGIDTVDTPHGTAENVLGGSAIYFALAASLFTPVRVVGVVGEDFDDRLLEPLRRKNIDTRGIEKRAGSRTFRWHGRYSGAMNEAETVGVELNVLAERGAAVPAEFADSRFVFLANTHPDLQYSFATQLARAELIFLDTMNLWITTQMESLRRVLRAVHGLVLNDGEARLMTGDNNLVRAGRKLLEFGPRYVVIKKGEHGSLLISPDELLIVPPYPTIHTVDPTGCGDTFAGALMGYVAAQGRCDMEVLRAATARASVVASFVIESFSVDALSRTTPADIEQRLHELRGMARFQ